MRRARRGLPWLAMIMLCDLIRRFFGDFRPADLVSSALELAFIVVVLWLELPERFHKKKVSKSLRAVQLSMVLGQKLQNSVPSSSQDPSQTHAWAKSVQDWIQDTQREMAKHSTQAGISFAHFAGGASSTISYSGMSTHTQRWYKELLWRLDNLRNIMEKADVYF